MPALRNKRHERFVQEWLGGKTRADAWTSVTGRRSADYASRVGNRPEVVARMAALKAEQEETQRKAVAAAAARFEVTAERVIRGQGGGDEGRERRRDRAARGDAQAPRQAARARRARPASRPLR